MKYVSIKTLNTGLTYIGKIPYGFRYVMVKINKTIQK